MMITHTLSLTHDDNDDDNANDGDDADNEDDEGNNDNTYDGDDDEGDDSANDGNLRSGLRAGAKIKKKRERNKRRPDTNRDKLPSAHQSLINLIIRDLSFLIKSEFTGKVCKFQTADAKMFAELQKRSKIGESKLCAF